MILIKSIEYVETDRDPIEIISKTHPNESVVVNTEHGPDHVSISELTELVRGRVFCRPSDGKDISIGATKMVQDIIGIQYEAWENLQHAYAAEQRNHRRTTSEMYGYKSRVDEMLNSTFWQRLKWLVLGYR